MPEAHEVAARLHEIADRLNQIGSHEVPHASLYFTSGGLAGEADRRAQVDLLATALTGQPGETKQTTYRSGWEHRRSVDEGGVALFIRTDVDPPAEEDPAVLRARIAELEARLADGGDR